jgi:ATP-binding cassette, subfamily B, bacterial MsbA
VAKPASALPPGPPVRRLWPLVRPHLLTLALASVLVLAGSATVLVAPRVAGMAVDSALLRDSAGRLDAIAALLVGLFALRGALSFAEHYLLRKTGAHMLRGLRARVHGHLLDLGPTFHQGRPVGELLSRLSSDLERIQTTLTLRAPQGARAGLTFVGAVIILVSIHWQLALASLALVPIVLALAVLYGRRLQRLTTRQQDASAGVSATGEEALSGMRTIQSFAAEDHERARYRHRLDALFDVQLESARIIGLFNGLLQFVGFSAFALVVWYGGRLIAAGDGLTPGELTASLIYTFAIASAIGPLGFLYAGVRELRGASARIFEILDETPAIEGAPDAAPLEVREGAILLDDVAFRYPESDRFALGGVSLRVEPGEVVAIVGPSGAGKSTLFALLERFYDPTRGRIAIDGQDLRKVELASLRGAIASVAQDVFLFAGTIADNLRLGRPDATDDEVREAALRAGADAFIRQLPGGYEARAGERGVKLSAGQRQRLAIARALLGRPAILLLDEATNALDPDSEALVQKALAELETSLTTLVIAHRLSTARRADRIVVLDGGQIVASGPHHELLETSELYRRYWELQAPAPPRPAPVRS